LVIKDNQYWREITRIKLACKGERIVDICRNVKLADSSVHTIHDNANRIRESAESETSVCVARLWQSYRNEPYQKTMPVSLLHFYCIRNK
jgi:hypothetical protein